MSVHSAFQGYIRCLFCSRITVTGRGYIPPEVPLLTACPAIPRRKGLHALGRNLVDCGLLQYPPFPRDGSDQGCANDSGQDIFVGALAGENAVNYNLIRTSGLRLKTCLPIGVAILQGVKR